MPTKRPDELPEGEDFNFDDILMVEKNPDSPDRKLYKTTLRGLMEAALKIDPERMGSNAIVGTQSQFDWLIEQMNKIQSSKITNVDSYDEYESPTKDLEESYVTPTPTPTPSITPTITLTPSVSPEPIDPSVPRPSPTSTPTPSVSRKPLEMKKQITIEGRQNVIIPLPEEHKPERYGYNTWSIKPGRDTDNVYINYFGVFPDLFKPSSMGERLMSFVQIDQSFFRVEVGLIDSIGNLDSTQGLTSSSDITFTIIYS